MLYQIFQSDALIEYFNACHFKLSHALALIQGTELPTSPNENFIRMHVTSDGQANTSLITPLSALISECKADGFRRKYYFTTLLLWIVLPRFYLFLQRDMRNIDMLFLLTPFYQIWCTWCLSTIGTLMLPNIVA